MPATPTAPTGGRDRTRDYYMRVYARVNGLLRLQTTLGVHIHDGLEETRTATLAILTKHVTREELDLPWDAPDADVERRLAEKLHWPSQAEYRRYRDVLLNSADDATLRAVIDKTVLGL